MNRNRARLREPDVTGRTPDPGVTEPTAPSYPPVTEPPSGKLPRRGVVPPRSQNRRRRTTPGSVGTGRIPEHRNQSYFERENQPGCSALRPHYACTAHVHAPNRAQSPLPYNGYTYCPHHTVHNPHCHITCSQQRTVRTYCPHHARICTTKR